MFVRSGVSSGVGAVEVGVESHGGGTHPLRPLGLGLVTRSPLALTFSTFLALRRPPIQTALLTVGLHAFLRRLHRPRRRHDRRVRLTHDLLLALGSPSPSGHRYTQVPSRGPRLPPP